MKSKRLFLIFLSLAAVCLVFFVWSDHTSGKTTATNSKKPLSKVFKQTSKKVGVKYLIKKLPAVRIAVRIQQRKVMPAR